MNDGENNMFDVLIGWVLIILGVFLSIFLAAFVFFCMARIVAAVVGVIARFLR